MGLVIIKPGIYTTIQDLGRTGAQMYGVNPGGVMDRAAARIVNSILGNEGSAAVLEMHFPAPEVQFDRDVAIAIGGADFGASVDGIDLRNWSSSIVPRGSTLKFKKRHFGNRAYLAVHGGLKADTWLGSASTNFTAGIGGFGGRRIAKGDRIGCSSDTNVHPVVVGPSLFHRYSKHPTVRVVSGSEFDLLTAPSESVFLSRGFRLTPECDRMGYRLDGSPLHLLDDRPMISAAVTFGTIQLLPDGQMIVLMADHQTSGGYPRVGTVISVDLPLLAQCGPGDEVRFELVSIDQAEAAALNFESELNFLRVGCRLQSNADDRS